MMVYVLFNGFTKDEIVEDLKGEGYPHVFYFRKGDLELDLTYMEKADEVWVFGECKELPDFIIATDRGYDIWYMG